jgi:hypothetical protein
MLSGTFLELLQTVWAPEWVKITGADDASKAIFIVAWDEWLRSTIIPSLFISFTTR